MCGIRCAVVIEELIVSAGDFVDFLHIAFHDFRKTGIKRICRFSILEKYVWILYGGTLYRMFWIQCIFAEFFQRILIQQFGDILIIHYFNFLQLVRGTESVKEMDKRYAAFDGGQMRHAAQIHYFLYRSRGEHSGTDLTTSHHIRMISKNGKCMGADGSGADMEYTGF